MNVGKKQDECGKTKRNEQVNKTITVQRINLCLIIVFERVFLIILLQFYSFFCGTFCDSMTTSYH